MLDILRERVRQGHRTGRFPAEDPQFPPRFAGRPMRLEKPCPSSCQACKDTCPVQAIATNPWRLDLGACVFCGACIEVCPTDAIRFSSDFRMASRNREGLQITGDNPVSCESLGHELRALLGRSLRLRQVSAGGCNACEADANVLGTLAFDMGRFGIQFVASPRHADGVLVTGPITRNMSSALRETIEATPMPRIVIAAGACACSGGVYQGHPEVLGGAQGMPVDLWVPGCPPHPYTLLEGLLTLLGRTRRTPSADDQGT